jgi:hypothetical protein
MSNNGYYQCIVDYWQDAFPLIPLYEKGKLKKEGGVWGYLLNLTPWPPLLTRLTAGEGGILY